MLACMNKIIPLYEHVYSHLCREGEGLWSITLLWSIQSFSPSSFSCLEHGTIFLHFSSSCIDGLGDLFSKGKTPFTRRRMEEFGNWVSIYFVHSSHWLADSVAVKFQRWLEDAIKKAEKVYNKKRTKSSQSHQDSLEILYIIIECLIICVAYKVSIRCQVLMYLNEVSTREFDGLYSHRWNKLLSCHLRKIVIPRGFLNLQPVLH